ncbi:MAG: L-rhamnose mutarotase [Chloroflexota bacterium]|jgi:L-rhamnose mutarotase
MQRFGQTIRLRPERATEYEALHAAPWSGVLDAIRTANIRNYSIFRHDDRLFAYFEYVGDDFDADMARMAADPVVAEWWSHTDAMQEPFPEGEAGSWWLTIPEIFHTD